MSSSDEEGESSAQTLFDHNRSALEMGTAISSDEDEEDETLGLRIEGASGAAARPTTREKRSLETSEEQMIKQAAKKKREKDKRMEKQMEEIRKLKRLEEEQEMMMRFEKVQERLGEDEHLAEAPQESMFVFLPPLEDLCSILPKKVPGTGFPRELTGETLRAWLERPGAAMEGGEAPPRWESYSDTVQEALMTLAVFHSDGAVREAALTAIEVALPEGVPIGRVAPLHFALAALLAVGLKEDILGPLGASAAACRLEVRACAGAEVEVRREVGAGWARAVVVRGPTQPGGMLTVREVSSLQDAVNAGAADGGGCRSRPDGTGNAEAEVDVSILSGQLRAAGRGARRPLDADDDDDDDDLGGGASDAERSEPLDAALLPALHLLALALARALPPPAPLPPGAPPGLGNRLDALEWLPLLARLRLDPSVLRRPRAAAGPILAPQRGASEADAVDLCLEAALDALPTPEGAASAAALLCESRVAGSAADRIRLLRSPAFAAHDTAQVVRRCVAVRTLRELVVQDKPAAADGSAGALEEGGDTILDAHTAVPDLAAIAARVSLDRGGLAVRVDGADPLRPGDLEAVAGAMELLLPVRGAPEAQGVANAMLDHVKGWVRLKGATGAQMQARFAVITLHNEVAARAKRRREEMQVELRPS